MKIAPTAVYPSRRTEAAVLDSLRVMFNRYPDARGEGTEALASMMSVPLTEAWIIESALAILRDEGGEVLA